MSGFLAGLWHPLMVPAHIVALFGLGLLIGQQSRRRAALAAFALGLIAGLGALASGVGETPAEIALLTAAAVAGLGAAAAWPVPTVIAAPLAAIVGTGIGLDSPPQAASIQAANAALAGTALGAIVLLGLITALAVWLSGGRLRIGTRILGSWVAASAILVVALRLAR